MSWRPGTIAAAVALALLLAMTGLGSSRWCASSPGSGPDAPVLGLTHQLDVLSPRVRLLMAAFELLVVDGVWRGDAVARTLQKVWSGVVTAAALTTATGLGGHGWRAGVVGVVTLVGSVGVLVLLCLQPSRAWFRERSVRPARPHT